MTRDEIEDARRFLKTYFPNNSDDRHVFNTICDMAVKSLHPECEAWIATHESGRVLHLSKADGWKVEAVQ